MRRILGIAWVLTYASHAMYKWYLRKTELAKTLTTKTSTGWETSVELHPQEAAGDLQVEVSVYSYSGLARVFMTRKQAARHFQRALALIQQDSPFDLVRMPPDPGYSIAYKVVDKRGRKVGVIQREADNSKAWWVQVGDNEHSEGTGYSVRWAALKFLESKKR